MKILVINAGSSSIKYQLIDMENENVIAKGLVEKIGLKDSRLVHKANGTAKAERRTFSTAQIRSCFFFLPVFKLIMTVPEKFVILIVEANGFAGHTMVNL